MAAEAWGERGETPRAMQLRELSAYWMPRGDGLTVTNDIALDSMVLLTGPNMAGKSTLARAICAAALLANCGLLVPCGNAVVPRLDGFMLRNLADDSPLERVSSYAVEMLDAATMLRDSGPNSLVLVDELGKGTEPRAAAAIAASVLESLARKGCRGVFATHHHLILDMPLQAPGLRRMSMEVVTGGGKDSGRLEPTWRVVEGECRKSLALQVAADMDMPSEVVARAEELLRGLTVSEQDGPIQEESRGQAAEGRQQVVDGSQQTAGMRQEDGPSQEKNTQFREKMTMEVCSEGMQPRRMRTPLKEVRAVLERAVVHFRFSGSREVRVVEAGGEAWTLLQVRRGQDASPW
jgi:DNA mismatch repair ATPase MutS